MTRPHQIQAVIVTNNRPDYLEITTAAFRRFHATIPCIVSHDDQQEGMAINVARAWQWAYQAGTPYILHLEDDMEILRQLPLRRAEQILHNDPSIASVVFPREATTLNPYEIEHGCVIAATCAQTDNWHTEKDYTVHDVIFSLNPSVIRRDVIAMGWPPGNEAQMTDHLKAAGYKFAFLGHPHSEPYIRHIGVERGPGWRL